MAALQGETLKRFQGITHIANVCKNLTVRRSEGPKGQNRKELCSSGLNVPVRPTSDRPVSTQIRFPNRPLACKEIQMIRFRVKQKQIFYFFSLCAHPGWPTKLCVDHQHHHYCSLITITSTTTHRICTLFYFRMPVAWNAQAVTWAASITSGPKAGSRVGRVASRDSGHESGPAHVRRSRRRLQRPMV